MSKLPVVSGSDLIKVLSKLGYEIVRQKGSHVRLKNISDSGEHNVTVPMHKELAKGTLNDILSKVSVWNNMTKDELIEMF